MTEQKFRELVQDRLIDIEQVRVLLGLESQQGVRHRVEHGWLSGPILVRERGYSLWDRVQVEREEAIRKAKTTDVRGGGKGERRRTHREGQAPSLVYFAEADGLIKIGSAKDPAARCRDLKADLLAVEVAHEREVHRRFEHLHERGEWFRSDEELRNYIQALAPATLSGT